MGRVTKNNDVSKFKKDLELRLQKHFEDMLRAEIRWMQAFGVTYRKNGQIISGNPRNTIDTKETFKKLRVDITGTVNFKISIKFLNENASYIFSEDGHRSEYFDYALKKLPAYISKLIVKMEIEARLGSKSKKSYRQIQKVKIKRKSRKK